MACNEGIVSCPVPGQKFSERCHVRTGLLVVVFGILALGVIAPASAQTCTVGNWSASATTLTDSAAGTPADSPPLSRYEGVCSIGVPLDGTVQHLGDNTPGDLGGLSRYRARFYVNTAGAGLADGESIVLFRGFDAADGAGTQQFEVRVQNSGGTLEGVLEAGGQSLTSTLAATAWHSLEIDWNADATEVDLTVDGQASGGPVAATLSGTIHSVLLGNLGGLDTGGSVVLDAFESRRSQPAGRLCAGDTNLDGQRDLEDVFAVFDEHATASNKLSELASGQPDFDENAVVDLDDVFAIFELFALAQGGC